MPLPSSGQISADDLNNELGNSPSTQIDFQSAATDFGVSSAGGIRFDEFYGLSAGYNFAFSDWNGTVNITEFGVINATTGNASSVTVNTSNFGAITSTTTQTVSITVVAPSTFDGQSVDNAGSSLTNTVDVSQTAVSHYLDITANDTTLVGSDTSVDLTINDIYYTDTVWSLSDSDINPSGLSIGTYEATSGTGDDTITVYLNQNTSGTTRGSRFTVTAFGGSPSDYVDVTQTSYTPIVAPTISITAPTNSPPSLTFAHDDTNAGTDYQTITFGRSAGSSETSATARIYGSSNGGDNFKLISTNPSTTVIEQSTDFWVASFSTVPASSYTVGVVPQSTNSGTNDFTGTVELILTNSADSDTESIDLTQTYQAQWSTDVSSVSWRNNNYGTSQFITLDTSYAWTAVVSNSHFSINYSSGTAGTNIITVSSAQSDLGETGTVTFSATGQSDIVVNLTQSPEPLETDWFFSVQQQTGTSLTLTPSTIAQSYAIGLYAYKGSTPVATDWELDVTSASSWITVNTTTSGGSGNVSTTTTQNTGGTPYLYINVATNSGSARNGSVDVQLSSGTYIATISVQQSGTSGGGGGAPKEDIE